MRAGAIRLFAVPPGTRHLAPLVRRFCSAGYGVITGTSDAAMAAVRGALPEEAEIESVPFGALVQSLLARFSSTSAGLVYKGHYTAAIGEALSEAVEGSP